MTAFVVSDPFRLFTDRNGDPLLNGYLYLGQPNLPAQTNPIPVFWDAAATIPALQPIRTLNGYPSRNGIAARFFVQGNFSITILDKNSVLMMSEPDVTPDGLVIAIIPPGSITNVEIANNAVTQAKVTDGYVDLVNAQNVGGPKNFTDPATFPAGSIPAATLDQDFVNDFATVSISTTDFIPFTDVSDANITRKALVSQLATLIGGGGGGGLQNVLIYTTNGNWTKPVGLIFIELWVQAGGGGSGAEGVGLTGSGGGGGGWQYKVIQAASLGAIEAYVVGLGGTAGVGAGPGGDGGPGGTSSFGAHVTSLGGLGGLGNFGSLTTTYGGAGAGGDMLIAGATSLGGGGDSHLGMGGNGGPTATGYGAGGSNPPSNPSSGFSGTGGIIIVKEYF